MINTPPVKTSALQKEVDRLFALQKESRYEIGKTSARQRIEKLRRIESIFLKRRQEIKDAMYTDFKKPGTEVDISEIYPVTSEIKHVCAKLVSWMRPQKVDTPITFLGSTSFVQYEARGQVLIISPWNFPFNLTFSPLVSAVAAGNTVILKPSELTPNCSALMKSMVGEIFDEKEVALVEGDRFASQALLEKPFDHIFFTGSPQVGKIVMRAAAEHLTTVTLELGGKSPAIVDKSANISNAARKIAWGKLINNGQTCIAPDYALVHEKVAPEFIENVKTHIKKMYGDSDEQIRASDSYARIVNQNHVRRIEKLIDDAVQQGARIECGGTVDTEECFIAPTVLSEVSMNSSIMEDEIFGPVLPVVTYSSLEDAIAIINSKAKPLALYVFTKQNSVANSVLKNTSAGGTCINDNIIQFSHINMPFGGVNNSGMGQTHGFFGFRAFSHGRSVLRQLIPYGTARLMYPPYTDRVQKVIDLSIKLF